MPRTLPAAVLIAAAIATPAIADNTTTPTPPILNRSGVGAFQSWQFPSPNTITVNGSPFFNYNSVIGGSGTDIFFFGSPDGAIIGTLDGGAGSADSISFGSFLPVNCTVNGPDCGRCQAGSARGSMSSKLPLVTETTPSPSPTAARSPGVRAQAGPEPTPSRATTPPATIWFSPAAQ